MPANPVRTGRPRSERADVRAPKAGVVNNPRYTDAVMCGIAGIVHLDRRPCSAILLAAMSRRIRHRGPDDEGYVLISPEDGMFLEMAGPETTPELRPLLPWAAADVDGPYSIGLAHRRYSVIDLTAAGHQPLFDSERTCCVVSNGEIYNYIELRSELLDRGHAFRSASDTEVIVEAYKEWGVDCFPRFQGMWALALFDFRQGRLILSRDRVGKRPLYWTRIGHAVYFASEIKALLEVPEIAQGQGVNADAIAGFLRHGFRDIGNSTFFRDIYSLPAASYVIVDSGFPETRRRFWNLPATRLREDEISVNEACRAVRETLGGAVSIRLRADVPWALELSGGMDSSVLVAMAAEQSLRPVVTFTIRYPDKEYDEEPYARSVAAFCGTDYRVVDYPTQTFWSEILPFTDLEEEPYHSPNLHTNQVIRRSMRENGVRMVLNGAGGDELLAGYPEYFSVRQLERLRRGQWGEFLGESLRWTESRFPQSGALVPFAYLWSGRGKPSRFSLAERLQVDVLNYKIPYWLRSGDKTHMGLPIESRNPFLDHRVVELAFQLPLSYLLRNGWHKWILRKSFEGRLPEDVLWRKRKMGFPFPYRRFFDESQAALKAISGSPPNPHGVRLLAGSSARTWRSVSFLLWYELYFARNLTLFEAIASSAVPSSLPKPGGFFPEFLRAPAHDCKQLIDWMV